jgi:deoxyribose-phosphate aldolase
VAVCSVVGFPLGHELLSGLESATAAVVALGADEIDMVVSTGALISGRSGDVAREIETVVRAATREREGCIVKVIMETHLLEDGHLIEACRIVEEAGAHFVKTTTGFTGGGATPAEVGRLKTLVGDRLGVKASAGIRTLEQAEALVAAGADRLGTSSGVAIATEWKEREEHAHAV